MDIDKLILLLVDEVGMICFGSLMDIDKLIPAWEILRELPSFGSLMDIDKLIRKYFFQKAVSVLVL